MTRSYPIVTQEKTKQPLRIKIVGQLAELLERIEAGKAGHKVKTAALLVNMHGKRLTAPALRSQFDKARHSKAMNVAYLDGHTSTKPLTERGLDVTIWRKR